MTVSTRTVFLSCLRSYSASSTTSCAPPLASAAPSRTEPPHERTLPVAHDLLDMVSASDAAAAVAAIDAPQIRGRRVTAQRAGRHSAPRRRALSTGLCRRRRRFGPSQPPRVVRTAGADATPRRAPPANARPPRQRFVNTVITATPRACCPSPSPTRADLDAPFRGDND
ncbi:hypothetical protein EVAR_9424_1 [Eumeta japonica]|uniref:Uncharacterized protein n=1 Tax=Eumeta variegata TaxID=151549 RepID=A0A4C1UEE7_EUMVA|nr:hypothetical protein EVAR_9424_1 [Eumeta japonica]